MSMEFPLGGGINGLAAEQGAPVWTFDYYVDPRIPHEPDDRAVAERLGLRGMAAAPLRAPGGEVIGTLAVSSAEPRTFEADELRPAPGPRRPGGHRPHQLEPARPGHPRGGALPRPRPDDPGRDLARRRRWLLHVHGRDRRRALRLADRGDHRQALRVPDRSELDVDRGRPLHRRRADAGARRTRAPPARAPRRLAIQRRGDHDRRVRGWPLGGCPGHGPRRQRTRPPGERAAPVGGALSLPRPERPGHRLVDRCRRRASPSCPRRPSG